MTQERMAAAGMSPLQTSKVRMTTPRLYAFAVTGALHIVLIVALLSALNFIGVTRPLPPAVFEGFIEAPAKPLPPLQPPAVEPVQVPVVAASPPSYQVASSNNAITMPIVHVLPERPRPPMAIASAPVLVTPRVAGRVGPPPYPSVARRLEQQGSVVLGFVVGADGRVLPDSIEVLNGSGFERLDDAARLALTKIRFVAGTKDGVAVQMRHSFKITYSLNED